MINLTRKSIVCSHGAIDIMLLSNARDLGFDSRPRKVFLFSSLFCCFCFSFLKTYFHFLADLELQVNYELFISKIINFNNNYLLIHKLAIGTL